MTTDDVIQNFEREWRIVNAPVTGGNPELQLPESETLRDEPENINLAQNMNEHYMLNMIEELRAQNKQLQENQASSIHILVDPFKNICNFDGEAGSVVAKEWLENMESVMRAHKLNDNVILETARNHLTGCARSWFRRKSPEIECWKDFTQAFKRMFTMDEGLSIKWQRMTERVQKYGESLLTYFHAKYELCSDLNLGFDDVKEQILIGLRSNELCAAVAAKDHRSEDDLIHDLNKQERLIQCRQVRIKQSRNYLPTINKPSTYSHRQDTYVNNAAKVESRMIKPTNDSGTKCFNCNTLGHLSRNCPMPRMPITCTFCGKKGHFARICPIKQNNEINNITSTKDENTNIAKNVITGAHNNSEFTIGNDFSVTPGTMNFINATNQGMNLVESATNARMEDNILSHGKPLCSGQVFKFNHHDEVHNTKNELDDLDVGTEKTEEIRSKLCKVSNNDTDKEQKVVDKLENAGIGTKVELACVRMAKLSTKKKNDGMPLNKKKTSSKYENGGMSTKMKKKTPAKNKKDAVVKVPQVDKTFKPLEIVDLKDNVKSLEKEANEHVEFKKQMEVQLKEISEVRANHQKVVDKYEKEIQDLKSKHEEVVGDLKKQMDVRVQDLNVDLEVTYAANFAKVAELTVKLQELQEVENKKSAQLVLDYEEKLRLANECQASLQRELSSARIGFNGTTLMYQKKVMELEARYSLFHCKRVLEDVTKNLESRRIKLKMSLKETGYHAEDIRQSIEQMRYATMLKGFNDVDGRTWPPSRICILFGQSRTIDVGWPNVSEI